MNILLTGFKICCTISFY